MHILFTSGAETTEIETTSTKASAALDLGDTFVLMLGANLVKVRRTSESGWELHCSSNVTVVEHPPRVMWSGVDEKRLDAH